MKLRVIGSGAGAAQSLAPELADGEEPLAVYYSSFCTVFAWEVRMATVLLTDRRILIAKDRLFGVPRVDRALNLGDIKDRRHGAMYGTGPAWVLHLTDAENTLWTIQFSRGDECEEFVRELAAASGAARRDPVERFFDEARRRTALAPPGSRVEIDLHKYVIPAHAPSVFGEILMRGSEFGFAVLDGATSLILLEKM